MAAYLDADVTIWNLRIYYELSSNELQFTNWYILKTTFYDLSKSETETLLSFYTHGDFYIIWLKRVNVENEIFLYY